MSDGGGRSPASAPPATSVLVTAAVLAGCSLLRGGGDPPEGSTPGQGPRATGDTVTAPADDPRLGPADSIRAGGDSLRIAGDGKASAAADSAVEAATRDSMEAATTPPSGPVYVTDVEKLAEMGPVYTPYDIGPALERGQRLEGLLRVTILPVVQKHDLEPDEWARFWVLVNREGRVVSARLHLTSSHAAFDSAARAAAERFRYRPAKRDGETVPVWVLVRVSLLMG